MREKNEMPKDELEQEPPAPETPGAAAPDAGTNFSTSPPSSRKPSQRACAASRSSSSTASIPWPGADGMAMRRYGKPVRKRSSCASTVSMLMPFSLSCSRSAGVNAFIYI